MKSKEIYDIFSTKKTTHREEPPHKVIVDYREKNSLVVAKLMKLNFEIKFRELKVADYIVQNVAIERKTVSDFLSSMINKRLVKQLEEMQQYKNKLLLIEGIEEQELYSNKDFTSGINPNAIRGFLLSITLKHKIPIIFTKNEEDTAKYIYLISKKQDREMSLVTKKKATTKKEQLQFIVEGFPGIGPKTARKLLEKFGTIQNIINSPKEDLQKILGKKSEIFLDLIGREY